MIVQRFINRLSLPENTKVIINSIRQLNSLEFEKDQPLLELYHTPHGIDSNYNETVDSIVKNGFRESVYGNKGIGVYLSSHSSYGLRWVGADHGIMICYVKCDQLEKINRFMSEIPPGYEYVVKPDIVVPAFVVDYRIIGKSGNQGWRKLGQSGCKECDQEMKRCDCSIEPKIYPEENIIHWKN